MKFSLKTNLLAITCATLFGCSHVEHPPLTTVEQVDIPAFMGDWYVIAHIPTFIDDDAYNAVESYELKDNGSIATTFRFREGGFDGPLKTYHPTGYVTDPKSNAIWGMQFVWPIKADYRIVYLTDDYSQTIVARQKRDYVWIMARKPEMPEQQYQDLLAKIKAMGYKLDEVKRIPQQWPEPN
jgi:apolipoprotein D and lipocalin family protein